jgi:hypothetical protein
MKNQSSALQFISVFLKGDQDAPIKEAIECFRALERSFCEIHRTFKVLLNEWDWPKGAGFSCDPIDAALELWIIERRIELEALLKQRFSSAPEIAQYLEGCQLTASELTTELRQRFYYRAVAKHIDHLFRELQHFFLYGSICKLNEDEGKIYEYACHQLKESESAIQRSLAAFEIQPIALELIHRVPEAIGQYICYIKRISAGEFYPEWSAASQIPSGVVLDIVSWAYLTSDRKLWDDAKAKLIISA